MKKVRVEREMPFAKVGDELITRLDDSRYSHQLGGFNLYQKDVDKWIHEGWLSEVEEEKSLEDRLYDNWNTADHNTRRIACEHFSDIARKWAVENFIKADKDWWEEKAVICYTNYKNYIIKSLKEAK